MTLGHLTLRALQLCDGTEQEAPPAREREGQQAALSRDCLAAE